jgi:lysophospholipase L1-like esterase
MRRPLLLLLSGALLLASCSLGGGGGSTSGRPRPSPAAQPRIVYAALGASETVGVGTSDPTRQSFPQLLYLRLPRSALYYNFGLPGETLEDALKDELPNALAVHPTLVTVWFNVNDMAAGVPVEDYEAQLDQLVSALVQGGRAKVLVANSPPISRLPAYLACRPDPPPGLKCPLGAVTLPPPDRVDVVVAGYNAAVARVAARRGAVVVDVAGRAADLQRHPEYVSSDGLHPSPQGAAAIADAFAAAL